MESNSKNYELAYLLSPSIPEGEVLDHASKLTALIEDSKGAVKRVEEARKRRLAHPIATERNAYFGWTTFRMAPDAVEGLRKKMKGWEGVLRFLLVEEEIMPVPLQSFRTGLEGALRRSRPVTPVEEKPDEKLDLEALDKKLEEILGK